MTVFRDELKTLIKKWKLTPEQAREGFNLAMRDLVNEEFFTVVWDNMVRKRAG